MEKIDYKIDAPEGEDEEIKFNNVEEFIDLFLSNASNNAKTITRRAMFRNQGTTHSGKRDLYEILGYPETLNMQHYIDKIQREGIAKRIINAYPDAIWSKRATLQQGTKRNTGDPTIFEQAFIDLSKQLRLFQYLRRLDRLAGWGQYAVMMIGVRDGRKEKSPVGKVKGPEDILYLRPFSQRNVTISKWENDTKNPRYGLPLEYKLRVGNFQESSDGDWEDGTLNAIQKKTIEVHHSRLLHVADEVDEDDVFGVPRLQAVFNRLEDLQKVTGGSAEIYWINGRGGLSVNAQKDSNIYDTKSLMKQAKKFVNQMTRLFVTKAMDVKPIEFSVHDPSQHVAVIMDQISGATGIPKRILMGSERGELASSQDENNWLSRVSERRENFCEPIVLRPLIQKFMEIGALPMVDDYKVLWPDLTSMSERDKADIAVKKGQAIAGYANSPGGELIVPPKQFVEDVLGLEFLAELITETLKSEEFQIKQDMLNKGGKPEEDGEGGEKPKPKPKPTKKKKESK